MSTVSQFMGSGAPVTAVLTSNDTIQVGDLVALASDGNAYACNDPTVGGLTSLAKPLFASASTGVIATTAALSLGAASAQINACLLTGGNIAVVTYLSGSGGTFSVSIYNINGVLQYPAVSVAGNTGTFQPTIIPLTNGGFAVVYAAVSTNYPSFAVYSATGAVVSAPAVIQSSATLVPVVGFPLTGGGFVMAWSMSSAYQYAVIANSGSVTLNATVFFNATSGGSVAGAPLSGGGFILVGYGSTMTVKSYSAVGVVVLTSTSLPAITQQIGVVVLAGGGFAFYGYNSGGGQAAVVVTNSSLTQQGSTVSVGTSGTGIGQITGTALIGGAFQMVWVQNPNVSTWNNGAVYSTQVSAAGSSAGTTTLAVSVGNPDVAAVATSDGGSIVHYSQGTTSYLQKMNSSNAVVNSPLSTASTVSAGNATIYTNNVVLLNLGSGAIGRVIGAGVGSTYTQFYGQVTLARVPIGVALNAANATAAVTVQITGWVTTRLTFSQTYVCDYRTNTPPGQQLFLVGNSAKLNGLI